MTPTNKIYRTIGLMSGTSIDGVDAALVETDGQGHVARKGFLFTPYDDALRADIRACFNVFDRTPKVVTVEKALTEFHAKTVAALLAQEGLQAGDIDLIGFHGQTIAHAPEKGLTVQIGDGALLARLTGIDVVNDFRTADVKAGGQGAPLVPIYHAALATALEQPVAFLNIGGVANVTYINGDELLAFDTGPGNALVDDWMLRKTGSAMDAGGAMAKAGKLDTRVLAQLLSHAFFTQKPPKSLDRNAFSAAPCEGLSTQDGAATLAAFTAAAVEKSFAFLPAKPKSLIVAGGGRHNAAMMDELKSHLGVTLLKSDDLKINGDAVEAEAFAYLAVRSVQGLSISFPGTTGAPEPMTGGQLHKK